MGWSLERTGQEPKKELGKGWKRAEEGTYVRNYERVYERNRGKTGNGIRNNRKWNLWKNNR